VLAACAHGNAFGSQWTASGHACHVWQIDSRGNADGRALGVPRCAPALVGVGKSFVLFHSRDKCAPDISGHAQGAAAAVLGVAHHYGAGRVRDLYALAAVRA